MNKPRKIRVAVVDDYAPHREELGALLKLEGFETHVVDSGDSLKYAFTRFDQATFFSI